MSEEKLAEIFTALANSGGGYVIFGGEIRQYDNEKLLTGIKFEDINKCEKRIAKVMALIRPTIDSYCRKNQILFRRQDANVWILIFEVSNSLPEVYSFRKQCWCWTRSTKKGEQFEPSPLSANETFDFIAHKYVHLLQKASNIGDPPELTFGYVKWPYMVFSISPDLSRPFSLNEDGYEHILPGSSLAYRAKDGNSYLPSKYDPQKGILEWHQVEFGKFHSSQFFETELRLPIQNPEILREHNSHGVELDFDRVKDLDGHFEISLGAKLLSGLEINYFDALGDKLSTSEQQAVISKQSVIIVEMTLRITDLFRIRRYFPYRSLEFEGVLPENARYNDVEQILEDCGLRIKEERNYGGLIRRGLPRLTRWTAESRTENGRLNVILELHNRWYDLVRQISYGERQDTFSNVPTGHIRIEIGGYAEGAEDKELTDLLNRLQWRLKERFRYVKMS